MKKKLIPVVALSSVLGLGVVALASCGKEVVKTVEKEVEVHVHHYGIDVISTDDVTLQSAVKEAKVGDTVEVTATVNNPAVSLEKLVSPGVEFTAVEGKSNAWSFVMPEHTVKIAAQTRAVQFKITASLSEADASKGTIKVSTLDGTELTEAGAGIDLLVRYIATDTGWKPGVVKANDSVIDYDEELGGYTVKMPAKDLAITMTLVEAKSTIKVSGTHPVSTTIENVMDPSETAMIYNLYSGETLLQETFPNSGVYEGLKPGTPISLTTSYETLNLTGGHVLKKATMNGQDLPFEKLDLGMSNAQYIFADPTFTVPTEDIELRFEFELPELVNISVEATPGVEVSLVDPDMGTAGPAEGSVNKGHDCFFNVFVPDGQVIDLATSGIYDATGTLIEEFMASEEFGITARVMSADTDLRIVVNTISTLEVLDLPGNWISLEAIDDSGIKKNSLVINADNTFEFFSNGAYSYKTIGELALDPEVENVYTWESDDGKESLRIEPQFEVKGTAEDQTTELRWLNVRHTKNVTVNDFVFTRGAFTTITNRVNMSDGGKLARVSLDYASYGQWMLSDEKGFRPVKFIEGPGPDENFEYNKIYPLTVDGVETEVLYKSSKLNYPNEERGTYSDGSGIDVVLSGLGTYTAGTVTGTYEIDTVKGVITLKPDMGERSKWVIDIEKHTLSEYIPAKDILSDVKYTFTTLDSNFAYPQNMTLSFTNSDVFSLKSDETETAKSYSLVGNELTIKSRQTLVLTVDPVTLELTVKSGSCYASGDMDPNTKILPVALARTFTPAEGEAGTDSLVLGLDNQLTCGAITDTYKVEKIATGLKVSTKEHIYELDLAAKTYKDVSPKLSFDFMKGKSFKLSGVEAGYDDEMTEVDITTEIKLTFNETAATVDVSIKEEAQSFAFTPVNYSGTALAYTVDEQARTLTITVDEATTIVANIDPLACTLAIATSSPKIDGHTYALPTATLNELINYSAIIKGNTYKATAQYTDPYDADNEMFYPVDNIITVTFLADGKLASVSFEQEAAGYGEPATFTKADCTYTISDAGEIKISLGSYKYLRINCDGKTGELKINGSDVTINGQTFGLGNKVLTKQA